MLRKKDSEIKYLYKTTLGTRIIKRFSIGLEYRIYFYYRGSLYSKLCGILDKKKYK